MLKDVQVVLEENKMNQQGEVYLLYPACKETGEQCFPWGQHYPHSIKEAKACKGKSQLQGHELEAGQDTGLILLEPFAK